MIWRNYVTVTLCIEGRMETKSEFDSTLVTVNAKHGYWLLILKGDTGVRGECHRMVVGIQWSHCNDGVYLYTQVQPDRAVLSACDGAYMSFGHRRTTFYSAPPCRHCKRCTSYGNSVRLSVCASHAGIVSKRRHVARYSLHCRIAKCV